MNSHQYFYVLHCHLDLWLSNKILGHSPISDGIEEADTNLEEFFDPKKVHLLVFDMIDTQDWQKIFSLDGYGDIDDVLPQMGITIYYVKMCISSSINGRVMVYFFVGSNVPLKEHDFQTFSQLLVYDGFTFANSWETGIFVKKEPAPALFKISHRPTKNYVMEYKKNLCKPNTKLVIIVPGVPKQMRKLVKKRIDKTLGKKLIQQQYQKQHQRFMPPLTQKQLKWRRQQNLPITNSMLYGGEGYLASMGHFQTLRKHLQSKKQTTPQLSQKKKQKMQLSPQQMNMKQVDVKQTVQHYRRQRNKTPQQRVRQSSKTVKRKRSQQQQPSNRQTKRSRMDNF